MPTPAYILELRRHHGTGLLFLPGVSGVVLRGVGSTQQVLLVCRTDSGRWSLPAGIVEPGEQPGDCLVREIAEETGVEARIDRLALLRTDEEIRYPNGDRCQFVSMTFRCSFVGGEAVVGDEESTAVGWFGVDQLPAIEDRERHRIACALPVSGQTVLG